MANSKQSSKKKGTSSSKKKNAKNEKKFDLWSGVFTAVCLLAVLALLALGLNILAPKTYRRIVYSTPLDRNSPVVRFGDLEVTAEEYRYRLLFYNAAMEGQYGPGYVLKNPSVEKQIKAQIESDLKSRYAKLLWADELGITLDAQDKAEVDQGVSAYIEKLGGMEEFDKTLDKVFMSRDLYYRMEYEDRILKKLEKALKDRGIISLTDEDVQEYIDEQEVMFAKSILFSTQMLETEAEKAQKKALAERTLRRIRAGEDFDTLMYEFTEDPGIESYPDGYSFGAGQFVPEYEDAVRELEIDEVADLVTSEAYGYFIVKRIAPDMATYRDNLFYKQFNEMLQERIDSLEEDNLIHYYRGYQYIALADNLWETSYPASNT